VTYHLELRPQVLTDLRDAAEWYEKEQQGLGSRVQDAFFTAVSAAAQNPEMYLKAHGEFRRILLKRFPYALYFRILEGAIVFVLLFHGARDPQELQRVLHGRD